MSSSEPPAKPKLKKNGKPKMIVKPLTRGLAWRSKFEPFYDTIRGLQGTHTLGNILPILHRAGLEGGSVSSLLSFIKNRSDKKHPYRLPARKDDGVSVRSRLDVAKPPPSLLQGPLEPAVDVPTYRLLATPDTKNAKKPGFVYTSNKGLTLQLKPTEIPNEHQKTNQ